MINYETILSLFDDKLTLLEYLTKIEQALQNEKLTNITVTQTDASHVYFTFVFEDGSTIDTPTFTLPQGEQGEQGIQGVSVTNAEIDASGHLILTLSNGNTIDAGATGLQTVTASDVDSETATQYDVLKADGNGGASWGKVLASNIDPQTATSEKFLQAGLYGGAVWSKISRGSIDTTGEASGKVLTTDGNGGASWETASGGSLYEHNITIMDNSNKLYVSFTLIDNSSQQSTTGQNVLTKLNNTGFITWPSCKFANGEYYDGTNSYHIIGVYRNTSIKIGISTILNGTFSTSYININSASIYDNVTQIM